MADEISFPAQKTRYSATAEMNPRSSALASIWNRSLLIGLIHQDRAVSEDAEIVILIQKVLKVR